MVPQVATVTPTATNQSAHTATATAVVVDRGVLAVIGEKIHTQAEATSKILTMLPQCWERMAVEEGDQAQVRRLGVEAGRGVRIIWGSVNDVQRQFPNRYTTERVEIDQQQ